MEVPHLMWTSDFQRIPVMRRLIFTPYLFFPTLSLIFTCLTLDLVLISPISICSPLFRCLSPYLLISYLVLDLVYKPNRDPETNQVCSLGNTAVLSTGL